MKSFIFITNEGYTYQPESTSVEPDIENCQVLGFGKGFDMDEAFSNMLKENPYLLETSFGEVIGMEVVDSCKKYFQLKDQGKYSIL